MPRLYNLLAACCDKCFAVCFSAVLHLNVQRIVAVLVWNDCDKLARKAHRGAPQLNSLTNQLLPIESRRFDHTHNACGLVTDAVVIRFVEGVSLR